MADRCTARPRRPTARDLTLATTVYLSGVASRTHLLYAASYLEHRLADPSAHITVLDLGLRTFLGRRNVAQSDLSRLLPHDDRLVLAPKERPPRQADAREELVYLAIGAPGLKPMLHLRLAHPGRRLHVVVVDEGLGSYGNWRSRRTAWIREGRSAAWSTVRALVIAGVARVATDERWSVYRRDGTTWSVDDRVAAAFRAVRSLPSPLAGPRYAVLLAQPWAELGLISETEADWYVRDVAAQCQQADLLLKVKPHPAQRTPSSAAAGSQRIWNDVPAELDPVVLGAEVVIGPASTALLNLAALNRSRAIRVTFPATQIAEARLSHDQQQLLGTFLAAPIPIAGIARVLRSP